MLRSNSKKAIIKNSRTPKRDAILQGAVEVAWEALQLVAHPEEIGEHLGAQMDAELLSTHFFVCKKNGYQGWKWSATLARVPRAKIPTVCEVALVPGEGALLAPPWVPWAERIEPRDIKPGDVIPYNADDERLERVKKAPTGGADNSGYVENREAESRVRVLSQKGIDLALERWAGDTKEHPKRGRRSLKADLYSCDNCGFLLPVVGEAARAVGVCANEWSLNDGKIVSLQHSCGAHSETDVPAGESLWGGGQSRASGEFEVIDASVRV